MDHLGLPHKIPDNRDEQSGDLLTNSSLCFARGFSILNTHLCSCCISYVFEASVVPPHGFAPTRVGQIWGQGTTGSGRGGAKWIHVNQVCCHQPIYYARAEISKCCTYVAQFPHVSRLV
jgi:hypothetical protein